MAVQAGVPVDRVDPEDLRRHLVAAGAFVPGVTDQAAA
jgi:hypothetical protein